MIDLDRFKDYNDTYGHKAGDEFLIKVAQSIDTSVNNFDGLSCRMGGDEFAIAIFETVTIEDINRIFNEINITVQANKGLGLSIGVASSSSNINTFDELYVAADKALYRSKDDGRNQVSFYEN